MSYIKPIALLKEEIKKFESAIRHSEYAFKQGKLGPIDHARHLGNNSKFIHEYKQAIKILEYGKKERV